MDTAIQQQAAEASAQPQLRRLTEEEKNDLRKKVLAGGTLTLDEAKQVLDSMRMGQGAAVLAAGAGEGKKRGAKKQGMSDAALDAELDALLK